MCGLCGNYNSNPGDDWTLGPACAGQGTIVGHLQTKKYKYNCQFYFLSKEGIIF